MGQYPMTSFVGYGALQQIAQQGMIRACIQTVADDMSRKWIKIHGGDNSDPDRVNDLEDVCDSKYHLKRLFHDAFSTTGYMGGALIFIDTGESERLDLPLSVGRQSSEFGPGRPLRFTLIDPVNVSPAEYNAVDPLRPDYMKPRSWHVLGTRVHASRLLTVVDNEPPVLLRPNYNFLGIPQAQILWDYVLHWNECRIYTANLLRKISLLVVKTDTDAVLGDPQGVAALDAKMDLLCRYRDNDSVFVCDKDGEDVTNVQTSIAGCTDVVRQSLEMICAINRTPAVKTLGISPAGFNATGESDLKNYYDHINTKQELHRDAIQTCIRAIQLAEYGEIDPSITFDFVPLDEDNKQTKAATMQTKIGALAQLADRQAISAEELRQAVRQDADMGLDFLSEEMPEDLQQQAAQAFEGGQPGMGGDAEGGEPNLLDMMEQGGAGNGGS